MNIRWGLLLLPLTLALSWLLPVPAYAGSAVFVLSSVGKPIEVGQTFSVNLNINPGGSAVDTARVHLSFSNNLIEATGFTLSGKLSSASPGSSINNANGTLSWGGFTVDNPISVPGSFSHISFRALATGIATISVVGDSKLINNGEEVGNPGGFNQITVKIVPSTADPAAALGLTSPTHPDQAKWYQANSAQFKWNTQNPDQYYWEFDQSPDTTPTKPTTDHSKQIKGIKNGVWYFHLRAHSPVNNQEVTAHYKIQVDQLKPNAIEPYLDITDSQNLILKFATTDYHSGIGSYDVRINQTDFENVTSPYTVRDLKPGNNTIIVTAYDLAGNFRTGGIRFVLGQDGAISGITAIGAGFSVCATIPALCSNTTAILIPIGLILMVWAILTLRRRRTKISDVKTITHVTTATDPKTGKKLITETITKTDIEKRTETDQSPPSDESPDKPHHKHDLPNHKQGNGGDHKK